MPKRPSQTAEQMDIPAISIEEVRKKLAALPQKQKAVSDLTKLQIITDLKTTITETRKKGYGWNEIHKILKDSGVDISQTTLKAYMFEDRVAKREEKRKAASDGDETTTRAPTRRKSKAAGKKPRRARAS